jgi:exodeoxyribonuclease-3
MAEMSVVSLNVNGLRDHRKRRLLFEFLKNEKFDVIFLQETHIATVEDCVKWNKESGLKGYWSLGLSNSCGVGILLRDPDRLKNCTFRCDAAGRIVSLDCTFKSQDLRFINIYAPTDGTKRIESFRSLDIHFVSRRRLIIGGDFKLIAC